LSPVLFKQKIEESNQDYSSAQNASNTPFANLKLGAKSAYVFDLTRNEEIFELNKNLQLPLASLTKIMTGVLAKKYLPEWEKINLPLEAIKQEGDWGFSEGEFWTIKNLTSAMLISSSNDAAYALGLKLGEGNLNKFLYLMNDGAKKLKLNQTYFLNPTGLDITTQIAGAYGSAEDVSKMMVYAFSNYPDMLEITGYNSFETHSRIFPNTNYLVDKIPGILAGKTGFSDLAGGNLVVIADIGLNHPVAIVVLGSTREDRFDDVKKLYNETYKWLSSLD
jgi:D-alanyl-D-alanine carboxypeptidase